MKNVLTIILALSTIYSQAQSLKANRVSVAYKIPKGGELVGYKTYEVKLLTKALVLTQSEVEEARMLDEAIGVEVANSRKKAQLAQQYLTNVGKGFTLVGENKNPDIIVLLETSALNFIDVNSNWVNAEAGEVVARFEGSSILKVLDTRAGTTLWEKPFEIPPERKVITRGDLNTLAPGAILQLKFTKKSNKSNTDALLDIALNDVRLHFITNFLRNAGSALAAAYVDQKGGFQLPIYSVKGKQDYSELDLAAKTLLSAIEKLPPDQSIAAIQASALGPVLLASIAVWEKELALKSEQSGARINEEVATGLALNLASAYILVGQWASAHAMLIKTGFVVAEGTSLTNTGSAKEYFIGIDRMYTDANPAGARVLFTFK